MTRKDPSLRTPRGRVEGLGSAKHGTEHWWRQRVTAIALIFLSLYIMGAFFTHVVFGNFQSATDWLISPITTTFIVLFLAAGFWHAVLGLQVVIEDYIHCEGLKLFSVIAVKFIAITCATLGIIVALDIPLQNLIVSSQVDITNNLQQQLQQMQGQQEQPQPQQQLQSPMMSLPSPQH